MPEASPFWQNAFLGFTFLIVAWSVWSGWRAGVVREVLVLGGMFAGGFAALAVGGAVGPLVAQVFPVPGLVVGVLAGLVVGLGIYVGTWFLAALLFKRTAQQRSIFLRLLFGGGGAVVGLFVGVTFLWGALLFVRGLGGFYEGRFEPIARSSPLPPPGAVAAALVKLKRSLEAGGSGRQLLALDVMPDSFYRNFEKLGRVVARPETLRRFFGYPPIQELLQDPKIVAIVSDPDASEAARSQSMGSLLGNKSVLGAANDPALIAKIQKIDFEAALDYALASPASKSSASPLP